MIKYTDFPITSNYPFNKNIFILFQKKSISPFRLSVRQRFLFPLLFLVSPRQGATRALVSPCFSLLAVSRTPPERTHEYFKGPLPANDSPSRSSSPSAVFSTFAITVRCTLGGKTIPIGKRARLRSRFHDFSKMGNEYRMMLLPRMQRFIIRCNLMNYTLK